MHVSKQIHIYVCMCIEVCQSCFWAFQHLLAFRRGLGWGTLEAGGAVGCCVVCNILITPCGDFCLVFMDSSHLCQILRKGDCAAVFVQQQSPSLASESCSEQTWGNT